ncbi:MAG: hypothetical protein ABIR15_18605 [Chitinophagaceae bacterium]
MIIRMGLYDHETRGYCDGPESYGVNRNQGAESTLSCLVAHLAVLQIFNETYSTGRNESPQKNKSQTSYITQESVVN